MRIWSPSSFVVSLVVSSFDVCWTFLPIGILFFQRRLCSLSGKLPIVVLTL